MPFIPGAQMGELVVQELTGLPVIWKPLAQDGRTQFDDHPQGEGYSLDDFAKDQASGNFTAEQLEDKRGGCFVRVRMTKAEADSFWGQELDETGDDPVLRRAAAKRLDPVAVGVVRVSKAFDVKANVIATEFLSAPGTVVPVLKGEEASLIESLDTKRNSALTVGTAKTYATINGAITAASSGDAILCYATGSNTYTESISITTAKYLQIVGMVADQGLTITDSTANMLVTFATAGESCTIANFTLVYTGANAYAVNLGVFRSCVYRCIMTGGTAAVCNCNTANTAPINCIAYDGVVGFRLAASARLALFCTAVDCSDTGFNGPSSPRGVCIGCLAAGNTNADFGSNLQALGRNNVSSDATHTNAGTGGAGSFATSDFNNYAGDDFTLKTSVAATTAARLNGFPEYGRDDIAGGIRKIEGIFFAGASDPDPEVYDYPDPSNVTPDDTTNGVTGTLDLPDLSSVNPDDTLDGSAGTLDLPALNKVAPSDTLDGSAGTLDLPDLDSVNPDDTLEGAAGTLDLPDITSVLSTDTLDGVAGQYVASSTTSQTETGVNRTYTGVR